MNPKKMIAFGLMMAFVLLTCISCSIVWLFNATYNDGIIKEYQYSNGKSQFKMLFSGCQRYGQSGKLQFIDLYTNSQFVMKEEYEKGFVEENVFVVDPKAATIYLDDKLMGLGDQADNQGMGYISFERVGEQRMRVSINPMDPSMQKKTITIIPSDFILNDGKRVVNDTIRLNLYEERPFRRME